VVESDHLAHTLMHVRRMGIRIMAAHPHARMTILPRADLKGDCCLVFGSEGYGLSETLLDLSDQVVAVPMAGAVDSLNVASAAAVFLYEAAKQQEKI